MLSEERVIAIMEKIAAIGEEYAQKAKETGNAAWERKNPGKNPYARGRRMPGEHLEYFPGATAAASEGNAGLTYGRKSSLMRRAGRHIARNKGAYGGGAAAALAALAGLKSRSSMMARNRKLKMLAGGAGLAALLGGGAAAASRR